MKEKMTGHPVLLVADVSTAGEAWDIASIAADAGLDGIDLNANEAIVTSQLVTWLHERNMTIAVWVCRAPAHNDVPAIWKAMEEAGVDAFTSNLPPELEAWRRER
mmetsp:Transcript_10614/g.32626  ORF Transcript_10614/g.32626 Transcript_10614/m.32626 type:complete len:105 (-) Transcript_10614:712-1026(-)